MADAIDPTLLKKIVDMNVNTAIDFGMNFDKIKENQDRQNALNLAAKANNFGLNNALNVAMNADAYRTPAPHRGPLPIDYLFRSDPLPLKDPTKSSTSQFKGIMPLIENTQAYKLDLLEEISKQNAQQKKLLNSPQYEPAQISTNVFGQETLINPSVTALDTVLNRIGATVWKMFESENAIGYENYAPEVERSNLDRKLDEWVRPLMVGALVKGGKFTEQPSEFIITEGANVLASLFTFLTENGLHTALNIAPGPFMYANAYDRVRLLYKWLTGDKTKTDLVIDKIMSKFDETIVADVLRNANKWVQDWNKSVQDNSTIGRDPHSQFVSGMINSLMTNTAGMALSFLVKNPAPELILIGAAASGATTQDLLDAGVDRRAARWAGLINGFVFEDGTELIPTNSAVKLAFGKAAAKKSLLGIMTEFPGEEGTEVWGLVQDALYKGDYSGADNLDWFFDCAKQTAMQSGLLMFGAGAVRKGKFYSGVAKENLGLAKDTLQVLYNGLTDNLNRPNPTSGGFMSRLAPSAKNSWNFFKKNMTTMRDILDNEKHDVNSLDMIDLSFLANEYKISKTTRVLDDILKAKLNSETNVDLQMSAPLEEYYEKLFANEPTKPGTRPKNVREILYKTFYNEDFSGIKDVLDKFANRYNIQEKLNLEKETLEFFFPGTDNEVEVGRQISQLDLEPGTYMVQKRLPNGNWSRQKEVQILHKFKDKTLIAVDNEPTRRQYKNKVAGLRPSINKTFHFVSNNELSVVRHTGSFFHKLFDEKVSTEEMLQNPETLYVMTGRGATSETSGNFLGIDSDMTDDNFIDNQNTIKKAIYRAKRALHEQTEVPVKSVTMMKRAHSNLLKALDGPSKQGLINNDGLDVGDLFEIDPDGAEPFLCRVIAVDKRRFVWLNGWKATGRKDIGRARYLVERATPKVLMKGYQRVHISEDIAAKMSKNAPLTYEYLIKELADLKQFLNNALSDKTDDAQFIYKKLTPERETEHTVYITSMGEKTGTKVTLNDVSIKAKIIKPVATLHNGTTIYLTDQGYLDRHGNEWKFNKSYIYDRNKDFIATDDTGNILYSYGKTANQALMRALDRGITDAVIQSFEDYYNRIKTHPSVKSIGSMHTIDVVNFIRKDFPDIYDALMVDKELINATKMFAFSGEYKPKPHAEAWSYPAFSAIFVSRDKAGKTNPIQLTYAHELIHVHTGNAIAIDPNLRAELENLKLRILILPEFQEWYEYKKIEEGNEKALDIKNTVLSKQEILSYFLTQGTFVNMLKNAYIEDHTLYDEAMILFRKACDINLGIDRKKGREEVLSNPMMVQPPVYAYSRPTKWQEKTYKFGTRKFYDAILSGEKTSVIVNTKDFPDIMVGSELNILGTGSKGAVTVVVKRVDVGLQGLLGVHKETKDNGKEFWTATDKALAADISRTEGMTDFIPGEAGDDTPYGKGWIIEGSGAVSLFRSDSDYAFWRNKQCTRIVFELKDNKKTKVTGVTHAHRMAYSMPVEAIRSDLRDRYPTGASTLILVEDGVRTATTRGYALGNVGDYVTFENNPQKYIITEIHDSKWINEHPDEWSKLEGWDVNYIRNNQKLNGQVFGPKAVQTVFKKVETKKTTKVEKPDLTVPERIKYKHEFSEEDKKVNYVYNLIKDYIAQGKNDQAMQTVNWAVEKKIIFPEEVERLILRWKSEKQNPGHMSLWEFAIDHLGMAPVITNEGEQYTQSFSTEVADQMGLKASKGKKATKRKKLTVVPGTEYIGTGSYTTTVATNTGYYELLLSGSDFDSAFQIHHDAVEKELQKWIDTNGAEGLDPDSSIAQQNFMTYHDLFETYGNGTILHEKLKAANDRIISLTIAKDIPQERVLSTRDIFGEEPGRGETEEVPGAEQTRLRKEKALGQSDEELEEARVFTEEVVKAYDMLKDIDINSEDIKALKKLLKKGFQKGVSIPKAIADFVRRVSVRTGTNPKIVSDQIKQLMEVSQRITMDIPKFFKEAEYFGQDPVTYLTGVFMNNGLPETTNDGSISARGMAIFLYEQIKDENIHDFITREVEDYLYDESQKRTQEYKLTDRIKNAWQIAKTKRMLRLKRSIERSEEFLKSLRFYPDTPEQFKISVDKLLGAVKDLQVRSGKIHDTLWNKIYNTEHRNLITRIIALEDDMARAKQQRIWFPYVFNRGWNDIVPDDTEELKKGQLKITDAKKMLRNPKTKISYARRNFMKKEIASSLLERGLGKKEIGLFYDMTNRIPQIANMVLGIKYVNGQLTSSKLVIKDTLDGKQFIEHIDKNPMVKPMPLYSPDDFDEAVKVIKKEVEANLTNVRKYYSKFFEPMHAMQVRETDIGEVGRNYEKILGEYNAALFQLYSLPPDIVNNLMKVRNTWRSWTNALLSELKELGWIDWDKGWEAYAPYFISDPSMDWFHKRWMGLPKKMKEPPAFYTSTAYGTTRERFLTPESLVDHILNVKYDIIISRNIEQIARNFDASYFLTDEERSKFYKYDNIGNLNENAKAGQKVEILQDRTNAEGTVTIKAGTYVFWTPEYFKFNLGTDEEGNTLILGNTKSYLVEENIAKALNSISLPYNAVMEKINSVVGLWKKTLIYTIFPSFNYNNMIGDLQLLTMVHPDPGRCLAHLPAAVEFLVKYAHNLKNKEVPFSPFENKVKHFIDEYNIIEAGEMRADLGQKDVSNLPKLIASKMSNFAMWREAIIRCTNAFYIMSEMENGKAEELKKRFGFLGIDQNLTTLDYMGRVGKMIMIDYFRRSPAYQRWITGFLFPWGHFYFQASQLMGKSLLKGDTIPKKAVNFIKKASLISLPPMVFNAWNYGLLSMLGGDPEKAKELYEYEMSLTPEMRNRLHLVIGWYGGKLVVWTPQYLPDILIGTKFASVFSNTLYRAAAGEIGAKQLAQTMLKDWALAEGKSALFLANPVGRFAVGFVNKRDPLDGSPVFPEYDQSKLTWDESLFWSAVYFNKVCNPLLSTYITEYQKNNMTASNAMIKAFDRFGSWKDILGVREYGKRIIDVVPTDKTNLITKQPGERNITRELREETKDLESREAGFLREIKNDWIRSGYDPIDHLKSTDMQNKLAEMEEKIYNNTMSKKQFKSFKKRIKHIYTDPENNIKWANNLMEDSKPGSEEYKSYEDFKLAIQDKLKRKGTGIPVTIRGEKDEIIDKILGLDKE